MYHGIEEKDIHQTPEETRYFLLGPHGIPFHFDSARPAWAIRLIRHYEKLGCRFVSTSIVRGHPCLRRYRGTL